MYGIGVSCSAANSIFGPAVVVVMAMLALATTSLPSAGRSRIEAPSVSKNWTLLEAGRRRRRAGLSESARIDGLQGLAGRLRRSAPGAQAWRRAVNAG